ncbi:NACHT, LRR and PYD domains-containing protein 5 [Bos indicus x Bos taurus]|uniref:NLR family pyrin domain containing 5 n=1 Tax=Bos indicus x Bos taurus TaxID=30522 RepID=A0A4W2IDW4_BOBOX|nr:NACHT, LRR and PYD domains-containing protein 5 [Bos indicus x Bos taurus]
MREAKIAPFSNYGLQWCFEQLGKEEFQTFKALLKEHASESAACSFPLVQVDRADAESLASLLHEHCRASLAWKTSTDIFEKMSLSALSEMARDEMKKYLLAEISEDSAPTKTDQGPSMKEVPGPREDPQDSRDYRIHVMTTFSTRLDTPQRFEEFASECPDAHALSGAFNPDPSGGFRPLTVVLHGPPGVGKSSLARRLLLFWAQGDLYKGLFSYVFLLRARDLQGSRETSFAELISREWPDAPVPVEKVLSQPERLLIVVDGLEELELTFRDQDSSLLADWAERQPAAVLAHSLLKKVLLPECALLLTVQDAGLQRLQALLRSPRYLWVGGLSVENRMQLLLGGGKHCRRKTCAWHAGADHQEVLDKCQVPVVCALVREAFELQGEPGKGLPVPGHTLTGLYATFVFQRLAPKDAGWRALSGEERGALKGLCRLAADGVWNAKFVFDGDDLGVHGLQGPELSALQQASILLPDGHCGRGHAFSHLSLQEFFAALFYVLRGVEGDGEGYPLFPQSTKSLTELRHIDLNVQLVQMKRFLFGLVSKEVMRALETLLGCPVAPVAKQQLLHWICLLGQHPAAAASPDLLEAFYCLFETQDDEFVRLALNGFQEVWLQLNRPMDLTVSSFCLRRCQHLRKVRLDVRGTPKDEFAEAWSGAPQGLKIKTLDEHWEDLCSVLSTHPNLRQLDLSGSVLSKEAMKTLCVKLRQPACKIQNLIFKGARVTPGLRHLWMTLIINRNITRLDLTGCRLREEDVQTACEALRHPQCALESLRLDRCGLTPASCREISQVLATSGSLKSLSLTGNKVADQGVKSLCDALKVTPCTLQKLILGSCGLTAATCQDLASALIENQGLTHLSLSGDELGSKGMSLLCRAVKLSSCGLQKLALNACSLDVAGCGFLAFALMGNRHLTHLSLSMNPLEDPGMNLLCEVMMEPSCPLRDLDLVNCRLTASCCKSLSNVITRSPRLRSLDLAANALGDEGIAALCEGLKQKNTLTRLGLEACGLTSEGCKALSAALTCSRHLASLNLMRNDLGPRGMTTLCSAFMHPTSNLQTIGLWKEQYPARVRRLLEQVQRLKPHVVISDAWYTEEEEDGPCWRI